MNEIPNHVAIIMDGNGRWATRQGKKRTEGHLAGYNRLKKTALYILDKGVKYLSVYCFSTENFKREASEVDYLMNLFISEFRDSCKELKENNIKVVFSGRRSPLKEEVLNAMDYLRDETSKCTGGILNICLNYGGQTEIIDATKKIVADIESGKLTSEDLTTQIFEKYLYQDLPPVDLMIRTGGDVRVSNFLLWQIAYAEMYFPDCYWPDFDKKEFDKAIDAYNGRERRFGGGK